MPTAKMVDQARGSRPWEDRRSMDTVRADLVRRYGKSLRFTREEFEAARRP